MKISDGLQVEIFKVAAAACAAALAYYLARKLWTGATSSVSDVVNSVTALPSKAWQATKDAAQQVADAVITNEPLTPQQAQNLPYNESTGMLMGP